MIHIIDSALWNVTGRPATNILQILSERHFRTASLIAERLPNGTYRVHQCRIKTPPSDPIQWWELSALMTQEMSAQQRRFTAEECPCNEISLGQEQEGQNMTFDSTQAK